MSSFASETQEGQGLVTGDSNALKTGVKAHCPMLSSLLLPASGIRALHLT